MKNCENCGRPKDTNGCCDRQYTCIHRPYPEASVDEWIPKTPKTEVEKCADYLRENVAFDVSRCSEFECSKALKTVCEYAIEKARETKKSIPDEIVLKKRWIIEVEKTMYYQGINPKYADMFNVCLRKYSYCFEDKEKAEKEVQALKKGDYTEVKVEEAYTNYTGRWEGGCIVLGEKYSECEMRKSMRC